MSGLHPQLDGGLEPSSISEGGSLFESEYHSANTKSASTQGTSQGTSSYSKSKGKSHETTPLLPRYENDSSTNTISYHTTPSSAPPSTLLPSERIWNITKSALAKFSTFLVVLAFILMFIYLLQINSLREEIVKVPQLNIQETSLDSFASDGINVRVTGYIEMDYDKALEGWRFRNSFIKSSAGLIGNIDVGEQNITLYFDEDYQIKDFNSDPDLKPKPNPFIHTANATIPQLTVDIHNSHNSSFDFIIKVKDFGNPIVIGTIAQRLLADQPVHFKANSLVPISKWGLSFGKYNVDFDQIINDDKDNNDDKIDLDINIDDIKLVPNVNFGIDVITKLSTNTPFPIKADIPSLIWELKIPGCSINNETTNYQLASRGRTHAIHLEPDSKINITVESNLLELPIELLFPCDNNNIDAKPKSPLDLFIERYMSGERNIITIEGSSNQDSTIPEWLTTIIQSISFTVPFEGKTTGDDLIQGLEFKNFRLSLPPSNHKIFPPVIQPKQPPRVSATVLVKVKTPDLIKIDNNMMLKVPYTRGEGDLFSNGEHFAHVLIEDWIPCITEHGEEPNTYIIEFELDSVPLEVVDQTVFGRVMREVIVSGSSHIRVEAVVDAEVSTPIGEFVLTDLPAAGDTEIKSS